MAAQPGASEISPIQEPAQRYAVAAVVATQTGMRTLR